MTGFRVNTFFKLAALVVALCLNPQAVCPSYSQILSAQNSVVGPVKPVPINSKSPSGEVIKTAPKKSPVNLSPRRLILGNKKDSGRTTVIKYKPLSPSSGAGGIVAIQKLKEIDPDSVGIIDDLSGGLGAEMWEGADRHFVVRAIASLPLRVRSLTMRRLMRRLLLTQAVAPKGRVSKPTLFQLRVQTLFNSGDLKSALSLLSAAPASLKEEYIFRFGIDGHFLQNDTAGACQKVRSYSVRFKDVYWQKAEAFCLAMAGKKAEAALMSEVLAEQSDSIHPAFFWRYGKTIWCDATSDH
jgi:hypothetical protein